MTLLMVKLNRNKTSLHLVTSVYLNFRQAIYKGKKNQTSTPSTATQKPTSEFARSRSCELKNLAPYS